MIKLQNINTPIEQTLDCKTFIANLLKVKISDIKSVSLFRRSIDARKKPNIFYTNTYLIEFTNKKTEDFVLKKNKNASLFIKKPYVFKSVLKKPEYSPIVIGSGPAGLFAALTLSRAGANPIIIERGEPVEQRVNTVNKFWNSGELNENSNVQFGEGGAGTFSDGKLNTGIKDPRCRTVLELFHQFGADDDILVNAKPHIGTDVLRNVVKNIRNEIISLGGEFRFNTTFLKPNIKNNKIDSVLLKSLDGEYSLPCRHLILAIGNAARDTYENLWNCGIEIIPKAFAVGVRIEHLQESINKSQYGNNYSKLLPPAEYKLATHLPNGRGVYTFCMCPGGRVVNASSEKLGYVTNGMSYKNRDEINANSAVLVGINPDDFAHLKSGTPFGGIEFQRNLERNAFSLTNGKGVPIQYVGDFLNSSPDYKKDVIPTILNRAIECDIKQIFPAFVSKSIKDALMIFDKQIKGFASDGALLTAPETRSSTPIRILRNEFFVSKTEGIYPCGEGAGYAGGITSSAVDGIKVAEAIIEVLNQ